VLGFSTDELKPGTGGKAGDMRSFSGAEWDALTARAAVLGAEHGRNVAGWVDVDSPGAARRWLRGIEDGDPAVLDALPGAPLSGEHVDWLTILDLYRELGVTDTDDTDDGALCTAYEDAWYAAVHEEVLRRAAYQADGQ
jgi:hypothetical protein